MPGRDIGQQPPSAGPINGPISPGTVTKLIAARNAVRGTARSTASRPTGIIIAPPTPCSTREATSASTVSYTHLTLPTILRV